jgi:GntP family gluconate:H+ symporter
MIATLARATPEPVEAVAGTGQLIIAALVGIAVLVIAITYFKLHPFLALILGSLTVGAIAGRAMLDVVASFSAGVGSTVSGVGVLIALGAMFGKLLADSGGADQIVDTIVGRSSPRMLPWSMAAIGAIIGLPMFFEIGLVLLMPVIFLVAKRAERSIISLGIPALAGLSAMHGFVPPHPDPPGRSSEWPRGCPGRASGRGWRRRRRSRRADRGGAARSRASRTVRPARGCRAR